MDYISPITRGDHTCKPGCLVCAGEQRIAATRAAALPWQYVREQWRSQTEKPRTPEPEMYTMPDRFFRDEIRTMRLSTLDGNL